MSENEDKINSLLKIAYPHSIEDPQKWDMTVGDKLDALLDIAYPYRIKNL